MKTFFTAPGREGEPSAAAFINASACIVMRRCMCAWNGPVEKSLECVCSGGRGWFVCPKCASAHGTLQTRQGHRERVICAGGQGQTDKARESDRSRDRLQRNINVAGEQSTRAPTHAERQKEAEGARGRGRQSSDISPWPVRVWADPHVMSKAGILYSERPDIRHV